MRKLGTQGQGHLQGMHCLGVAGDKTCVLGGWEEDEWRLTGRKGVAGHIECEMEGADGEPEGADEEMEAC